MSDGDGEKDAGEREEGQGYYFIKGDQVSWRRCHLRQGLGAVRLFSRKISPEQRPVQI